MIVIDGSYGEGGGQILRSSLCMSCITGKAFHIYNIRKGRKKPGLMQQHLTSVKAAKEISDADVKGAEYGSTELEFRPKTLKSGKFVFDVAEERDSAGSTATDSKSFKVYNYANLTLVQGYFAGDGSQNTSDTMWGNWSGTAGSTQTSKNYLKAQNIEATGNGNVSISWSWTTLNNSSSGGTIALTNVNYYEGEAANPNSVGSWGAVPTDANHQNAWVTVTNNPSGTTTSWTNYTISIPSNTPTGTYTQSFTWSITT